MKRFCCALLALTLLCLSCAMAEEGDAFDLFRLESEEDLNAYLDDNRVDTVYRWADQPFSGDLSEGQLMVFLDYVELASPGLVALRFAFAVQTDEPLYATELTLSGGNVTLTRAITPLTTEYDFICMEDEYLVLTDEDFGLIEALLANDGTLNLTLFGSAVVTGQVQIPVDSLRRIWELYQACGGPSQDFDRLKR